MMESYNSLCCPLFQIHLEMGSADLSDFVENPEWYLENFWAEQSLLHQPCCPEKFACKCNRCN